MAISLSTRRYARQLIKGYPKNSFACSLSGKILAWKTDNLAWASCQNIDSIPEPLIGKMAQELIQLSHHSKTCEQDKKHRNDLYVKLNCTPVTLSRRRQLFIFTIDCNTSFYSDLDRLKQQLHRSHQTHCQFFFQLDNLQRLTNHDTAFFELCMQHQPQSDGLIGKLLTDVLPRSAAAEITHQASLVLETEFTASIQVAITNHDETKLYLVRTLPIKSDDNRVIGSLSLAQPADLPEANKTDSSGSFENDLIAELPALVYWKDKEQSVVGCNRELINYFHDYPTDSSELTLNTNLLYRRSQPQEVQIAKRNDKRVLSAGKMMTFEESVTVNGNKTIFLSYKKPLVINGSTQGTCGISVDITPYVDTIEKLKQDNVGLSNELARLQKNERKAEGELQWIIDHLPGNVFWENKDGVFLGCNQHLVEWLGLQHKEQFVGKNLMDLVNIHGIDQDSILAVRKNDLEIMRSGKEKLMEESVYKDGKHLTFLSYKKPVMEGGECVGLIGVGLDITLQKKLEQKLKTAHEEKSNFIANISHDLRTPLHTLYGTAEQLEQGTHLPEQTEKIETLVKCSKLILRLVDNVLHFSQLADGTLQLHNRETDLHELIDSIITTFKPLATEKQVELKHDVKLTHSLVTVDPNALSRILINLIQNAMKHTMAGSIELKVTEKETGNSKQPTFEFTISDTGTGIPPEELSHIFSRFYQGEKDKGNGLGLGLSITQRFVELMSGSISVKSEWGSGSSFSCSIPMQLSEKGSTESEAITLKQQPKILLIEDSRLVQTMTIETFKKQNWEYDVASTGEEALVLWRKQTFDIILLDLGLPDQSGLEVLAIIHQSDPTLPVITLTGDSSEKTKAECFEAGATAFLEKPASQTELIEAVKRALN